MFDIFLAEYEYGTLVLSYPLSELLTLSFLCIITAILICKEKPNYSYLLIVTSILIYINVAIYLFSLFIISILQRHFFNQSDEECKKPAIHLALLISVVAIILLSPRFDKGYSDFLIYNKARCKPPLIGCIHN